MRLLIVEAQAPTGAAVVDRALCQGHRVTAVVPAPVALTPRANLTIRVGRADDTAVLRDAMAGIDRVIVCPGQAPMVRSHDAAAVTRAVLQAARDRGVRRVVLLSVFGVGFSRRKASPVARLRLRLGMGRALPDLEAGHTLVEESQLEWTIVQPTRVSNRPRVGHVRVEDVDELISVRGLPPVPLTEVARFLVGEATGPAWVRRTAVLY